jgi:hypothetical protein
LILRTPTPDGELLAGGINRQHPDEHDLARADEFAYGMQAAITHHTAIPRQMVAVITTHSGLLGRA